MFSRLHCPLTPRGQRGHLGPTPFGSVRERWQFSAENTAVHHPAFPSVRLRSRRRSMSIRRISLAAALACAAPPAAAAAQTSQAGGADSAWVNLVSIMRLRDEFADAPQEARFHGHPARPWLDFGRQVEFPE